MLLCLVGVWFSPRISCHGFCRVFESWCYLRLLHDSCLSLVLLPPEQILVQRLKVPPSINQFSQALDKNQATELLKVLMKYQPEDKKAKQQRLKEIAAAKEAGKEPAPSKAPKVGV